MLASDNQDDFPTALGFSIAGDIVELVIFTADDAFLQTMREAVGEARRLWHVPSADKVSDLLLAGQVGILVLDVQALVEDPGEFVAQIKRQFPDLVLVAAGSRDAETALAKFISTGTVYRFIHKPMSPGRAKSFADAAVKRYDEQRRRAPAKPGTPRIAGGNRRLLTVAAIGVLTAGIVATWAVRRGPSGQGATPPAPERENSTAAAPLSAGESTDAAARAVLDEMHARLWAQADKSLLEEHLDEAAAAIETARKSGVDGGRIALLTARLALSRARFRAAAAHSKTREDSPATGSGTDANQVTRFLSLAEERIKEGRLIDPDTDSARFYIQEALQIDPDGNAAQAARQTIAVALLAKARADIDRHDFLHASSLLDAAAGIASTDNVANTRQLLDAARKLADTDASGQLLKSGLERLRQDRLIEPATDSAKYYLLTLRNADPGNAGLAPALQDLGFRLVAKARHALDLKQYDGANNWMAEAAAVGYSSAESAAVSRELEAAVERQRVLDAFVPVNQLTLVKAIKPLYPPSAEAARTEGWVELDFTVAESGDVADIAVHAANPAGVFDDAAVGALSQWRYKPVLKDSKPAAQRSRIRIRFTLAR